jgi:hypothetical protein
VLYDKEFPEIADFTGFGGKLPSFEVFFSKIFWNEGIWRLIQETLKMFNFLTIDN